MIIRSTINLALRSMRNKKVISPILVRQPMSRSYSSQEPVEYQAPNDNENDKYGLDIDNSKYIMALIIWPFLGWMIYDLFFVRRNQYSNKRGFKLISKTMESYVHRKYLTRIIHKPYRKYLLKQSTKETQRVIRVFQTIINSNNLFSFKNCKVMVYDLPNFFIYLSNCSTSN